MLAKTPEFLCPGHVKTESGPVRVHHVAQSESADYSRQPAKDQRPDISIHKSQHNRDNRRYQLSGYFQDDTFIEFQFLREVKRSNVAKSRQEDGYSHNLHNQRRHTPVHDISFDQAVKRLIQKPAIGSYRVATLSGLLRQSQGIGGQFHMRKSILIVDVRPVNHFIEFIHQGLAQCPGDPRRIVILIKQSTCRV